MKTVYISIGNSDDKLSQSDYHDFIIDLRETVFPFASACHGEWFTEPASAWQGACICIVVPNNEVRELRNSLRGVAQRARQDSIAMAVVDEVEMVKP